MAATTAGQTVANYAGLARVADKGTQQAIRLLYDRVLQLQQQLDANDAEATRIGELQSDIEQRLATVEGQLRSAQ